MKRFVYLFLCIALVACAKPKYPEAAPGTTPTPGLSNGASSAECGAKFPSGGCISLRWESMPKDESELGTFLFKFFRPNKVDASTVLEDSDGGFDVVLWMPSMGHGSAPITVEHLDTGTYRASQVSMYMRGDWEIRFIRKGGHAAGEQATIAIQF